MPELKVNIKIPAEVVEKFLLSLYRYRAVLCLLDAVRLVSALGPETNVPARW